MRAVPETIIVDEQAIPYREIHDRFSETEDGKTLGQHVRYQWYKPKAMRNEEWVKLLGPDVCNLEHLWWSFRMTRIFIDQCLKGDKEIQPEEQHELLLTALSHDWAEAKHGDIKWDLKNAQDTLKEEETLMTDSLLWMRDWMPELIGKVRSALGQVLGKHNKMLSDAFANIERMGYVRTGLEAHLQAQKTDDTHLAERLTLMTGSVMGNHLATMIGEAHHYPPLRHFLVRRTRDITSALMLRPEELHKLEELHADIEHKKGADERLEQARIAWHGIH